MTDETDIRALAFFTADHAAVAGGKLYVNGGFWNKLQFPSYPQMRPISVVAVLHIPYRAYHQDHRFSIDLEDADAKAMAVHVEGEFRVGTEPDMRTGDPTVMPIAVPVDTLAIERPGDYSFVLRVDGGEIGRYWVRAVQVAAPVMPGGGPPPGAAEPREAPGE